MTSSKEAWEQEAHNWAAWTRTFQHDAFHQFREAFFGEVVAADPGEARWLRLPNFLHLRARKE